MGNIITEPGFENGGAAWELFSAASIVTSDYRTGAACCQLGPNNPGTIQQAISLPAGPVKFSCWFKRNSGEAEYAAIALKDDSGFVKEIRVQADGTVEYRSDGSVVSTGYQANLDEWFPVYWTTSVDSWDGSPVLWITKQFGFLNNQSWFVDDCRVSEAMLTAAIRSAIVTDLGTISTANGFQTEVDAVYTEPKRLDEATKPCLFISRGSGSDELEGLTACRRSAEQTFDVGMFVRGANTSDEVDDLVDDVRDALQVSTSSVMSLAYVQGVSCSWDQPTSDAATSFGRADALLTVSVRYTYSGGSA